MPIKSRVTTDDSGEGLGYRDEEASDGNRSSGYRGSSSSSSTLNAATETAAAVYRSVMHHDMTAYAAQNTVHYATEERHGSVRVQYK